MGKEITKGPLAALSKNRFEADIFISLTDSFDYRSLHGIELGGELGTHNKHGKNL
jgi:hypothetical protein